MGTWIRNVRQAFAQVWLGKALTLPAIAGLALGIGASTAAFSLYDRLLLDSLGFGNLDRLVALWPSDAQHGQAHVEVSYGDLEEWRQRVPGLDNIALASSVNLDFAITGEGRPQQVESTIVTGNFFRMLGATPAAGRLLQDDDDRVNTEGRAVISHRLWQTRFGGDAGVIGRSLRSGQDTFRIVGVASADFDFPQGVDVWLPLRVGWPGVEQDHQTRVFRSVARMREGVSLEQLRSQMDAAARQMAASAPAGSPAYSVDVVPMVDEIYGNARVAIWTIGGAVLFVLLIACANAANLLLARASARRQELAVRTALGAGRGTLVGLLLREGLVMAALAGAAGLVLAQGGIEAIRRLAPPDVPGMDQIQLDVPVLLFGVGLALSTVLLFALGPAWFASKRDPIEALQQSGTRQTAGRGQRRWSGGLVLTEVAVSTMLLVCAGLLLRSFDQLASVDPGFQDDRLLTFRVTLAKPDQESRRAFYSELLAKLRALPGVESAAAVLLRPLSGNVGWDTVYSVEGQGPEEIRRNPNANYEAVSPGYFKTMGIRLLAGREFADTDTHLAQGAAIVNESTARKHWPTGNAVGQRIRLGRGANQPWLTVVGVVRDVRYREWEASRPDIYVPYMQRAQHRSDFVVKTAGDPTLLASAVQNAVLEIDKDQPISNLTTMDGLVDRALARSRFNGVIVGCLAGSAVLLAVIGLYGVLSHSVSQRRAEIGIRMAVGASPGQMIGMIASRGMLLTVAGVIAGGGLGWAAGQAYSSLLFGVQPLDPVAYGAAGIGMLVVSGLACAIPAIRASRVDPLETLR